MPSKPSDLPERRALVDRLFHAWALTPHLDLRALLAKAHGRTVPLSDEAWMVAVERYAAANVLGPPATPGGVCEHPPAETLAAIVCEICGAWKPNERSPLYYVPYINNVRTGYTPPSKRSRR